MSSYFLTPVLTSTFILYSFHSSWSYAALFICFVFWSDIWQKWRLQTDGPRPGALHDGGPDGVSVIDLLLFAVLIRVLQEDGVDQRIVDAHINPHIMNMLFDQ